MLRYTHLIMHAILGIMFNKDMSLKTQINNICKLGYYQIRNLWAIRNVLNMESAKAAANVFNSSTLAYGNSLLYGLPGKLQFLQNSAARVGINACKSDRLSMLELNTWCWY